MPDGSLGIVAPCLERLKRLRWCFLHSQGNSRDSTVRARIELYLAPARGASSSVLKPVRFMYVAAAITKCSSPQVPVWRFRNSMPAGRPPLLRVKAARHLPPPPRLRGEPVAGALDAKPASRLLHLPRLVPCIPVRVHQEGGGRSPGEHNTAGGARQDPGDHDRQWRRHTLFDNGQDIRPLFYT